MRTLQCRAKQLSTCHNATIVAGLSLSSKNAFLNLTSVCKNALLRWENSQRQRARSTAPREVWRAQYNSPGVWSWVVLGRDEHVGGNDENALGRLRAFSLIDCRLNDETALVS